MKTLFRQLIVLAGIAVGLTTTSFGQLQWNSYNNSGALVSANVASGGDSTYGGTVTFTVPANTSRIFMTETIAPISLLTASSSIKVNMTMSATGGLNTGTLGRILGMGLLNDPGTVNNALDDQGFWTDFNTGNPSFELFYRTNTVATFFQFDSAHKLGSSTVKTGLPTNNTPYGMQFQLNVNSANTGMGFGTSASSFAAAGAAMTNGTGAVSQTASSSALLYTTFQVTTFNEFAFMFNNTSAGSITVSLSGITLVPVNPVVSTQPLGYNGSPGDNTSFSVVMNPNSATPLSYQWYEATAIATNLLTDGTTPSGSIFSGSTNATLYVTNAQIGDNGNFFVVVANAYGSTTSSNAALNIFASSSAPTINSISFNNATVIAGQNTNVSVVAVGSPSPVFYWLDNNNSLLQFGSGASLVLNNVQPANAGTYTVIASNSVGTASTNFTLNVIVTPSISSQPTNLLLNLGDPASFSVTASGTPTPTYQWYQNNAAISGATSTTYSIASVVFTNIGTYTVVVGNAAGAVTSQGAFLAINSTMTGTPISPTDNATGVCVDTYLSLTFSQTPGIGNTGKVRIFNVTNTATPVDTIDLGLNNALHVQPHSPFAGDSQAFNYYPLTVSGATAVVHPHSGVLTTGQTYYVTIDPGVVTDPNGAYYVGFADSNTWQFSTKASGPANPTNLVVAADGSGDFDTVQGAVDFIPLNNTARTLVGINNGTYTEIVNISSKPLVTFRGQSRAGTIVGYSNNVNIAPGGTTHARMAFKVNSKDIAVENLTLVNTTPQGGGQAEALMIETAASRFILNNAEVDSRQDTILANVNSSQGYFYNSLITGNFDYLWGGGNVFITNCEIRTIPGVASPNLAAPRTDNGPTGNWAGYSGLFVSNGFSYVGCQLTRQSGTVTNCSMSDGNGSLNGLASWTYCTMDTGVYTNALATATNNQLLWEYGNVDLSTNPLNNAASPFLGFAELSLGDPRLSAVTNATTWLNGWAPQLAPNILTQPLSLSVAGGQPATFVVSATGIPDPTYQWYKNASQILNATNSSYTISNAYAGDAAGYTVIVTTLAGSATSSNATLTVGNTAPSLAPVSNQTVNVGVTVTLTNVATDPDVPTQTLAFTMPTGPAGAGVDPVSGVFGWRPPVGAANSVNPVSVVVTDNGTPPLSATNNFTITVNPLTQPSLSAPAYSGGQFTLSVTGQVGPDYALQVSTDLTSGLWTTLLRTNSPPSPFTFTDSNATGAQEFYRVVVGPPLP